MNHRESLAGRVYRQVYELICGKHPKVRPWHFQYLASFYLYRDLKEILPATPGYVVLDVGCGDAPYRTWFHRDTQHIGIDTQPGACVHHIIDGHNPWPIGNETVDIVLCTQVFEHARDLEHLLSETSRCLRHGGILVASFPFIYNEHGGPFDYRRISVHGAELLYPGWHLMSVKRQGGVGSTLATLWLNWRDQVLNQNLILRLLKALLLPCFIAESLIVNVLGFLLDKIDRTGSFYGNVIICLQKPIN
jgi:SAM-dependent methyltransferase